MVDLQETPPSMSMIFDVGPYGAAGSRPRYPGCAHCRSFARVSRLALSEIPRAAVPHLQFHLVAAESGPRSSGRCWRPAKGSPSPLPGNPLVHSANNPSPRRLKRRFSPLLGPSVWSLPDASDESFRQPSRLRSIWPKSPL